MLSDTLLRNNQNAQLLVIYLITWVYQGQKSRCQRLSCSRCQQSLGLPVHFETCKVL